VGGAEFDRVGGRSKRGASVIAARHFLNRLANAGASFGAPKVVSRSETSPDEQSIAVFNELTID
jgi:hypothetical protein